MAALSAYLDLDITEKPSLGKRIIQVRELADSQRRMRKLEVSSRKILHEPLSEGGPYRIILCRGPQGTVRRGLIEEDPLWSPPDRGSERISPHSGRVGSNYPSVREGTVGPIGQIIETSVGTTIGKSIRGLAGWPSRHPYGF